ncbi:MAG: tRNA (adenosine(37)-N6)-threonylcarbamoyltransferase complex ATPase subunit type 1 TsaE [Planctomycetes bacterium]|nr:tRNA (adenosine(37)-N6)-threonylcarbamoyltransferase complex ATPase subunit type 1 TsaE [Planctomycetota bacterium]
MTTSAARELVLVGDDATVDLGRRIGRALAPDRGGVVALSGNLGVGKTTFVKGLAEGLGVAEARDVVSPTFTRVIEFEGPVRLVHVDAYRMKGPGDVIELGLDEALAGAAVVALEWPEIVEGALPADRLTIAIGHVSEGRRSVRVEAGGPESVAWFARVDWPEAVA